MLGIGAQTNGDRLTKNVFFQQRVVIHDLTEHRRRAENTPPLRLADFLVADEGGRGPDLESDGHPCQGVPVQHRAGGEEDDGISPGGEGGLHLVIGS